MGSQMVGGHKEKLKDHYKWRIPARPPAWNAGCEDVWASEAQRSALERRSVVSGSCWIVWCNIKASNPARFVMAVRTLRSCSNSSSSLYHCQGRRAMRRSSGRPTSPWPHRHQNLPRAHAPGPPQHAATSPSSNDGCIGAWAGGRSHL